MSALLLEPPARRVVLSVDPQRDESLAGYLCRVAGENVISGPWRLLPPDTAWPPADLTPGNMSRLAAELGCERATIRAMFARSHGDVLGPRLRIWSRRRVAPASLRLAAYHRAQWQVRPLPFCPETWGAVIEQCPECQAALTWSTNAVDRCQRCWMDLKWIEGPIAPEDERHELSLLCGLAIQGVAEPIRPPWAHFLSASELFQLIVLIGRALDRGVGDPFDESRCLISGLRALLGAPHTIEKLAKLDRNEPEDPFFNRMRTAASGREGPLKDAIRLLLRPQLDGPGVRRLKRAREAQQMMTATDVAAHLQIERSQLRKLVDGGLLGPRSSRGQERTYDWFSRQDAQHLQRVVRGRVSAWTWGRRMGLGGADVRQLLAERLIEECADERLHTVFGGLQLDARYTAEIESAIKLCCKQAAVTDAWVPVSRAFRGVGGGYKPWSLLLRTAMRGELGHGLGRRPSQDLKIGQLCLHPNDVARIQGRVVGEEPFQAFPPDRLGEYRPTRLSWSEVDTLLNCNPADVARLRDLGCISKAPGDDGEGFDARSVELFSANFVSSLEMAALTGRSPGATVSRLSRGGWSRPELGFWPRGQLREMVECLKPRPWDPIVLADVHSPAPSFS